MAPEISYSISSKQENDSKTERQVFIEKSLPGGGPQGTIIALILFLVPINELGFSGQTNNTGDMITSCKRNNIQSQIQVLAGDDRWGGGWRENNIRVL